MKRRTFLKSSTLGGSALALSPVLGAQPSGSAFENLCRQLLVRWCKGLREHQINALDDGLRHGALWCPACNKIHGRCMDAVYPFLHMAHRYNDKDYLIAAIDLMRWSENVSQENGAWTVMSDPKSWNGITVFGAIALAEALHYHGNILPSPFLRAWRWRLSRAAEFVYREFSLEFTNINYGFSAIYALNLCGRILDKPRWIARSRELAAGASTYFTKANNLLWGEGKPIDVTSKKGFYAVDLGYNVEESLNALVAYALIEEDKPLLELAKKSMAAHVEFMLPDGAWDNSWGTRQYKWSYWGSRTTDGAQPALALLAADDSTFGSAAYSNTELLDKCTHDGLLHGGLHYREHGVAPCIHHTFCHAKVLAFLFDGGINLAAIDKQQALPRSKSSGVKHFQELDVSLFAHGQWRGTVSTYDAIYKEKVQQATGGSLGFLWHDTLGPIMTASLAQYILVEKNNQQVDPDDEDIALTPRLEAFIEGTWYTNLYDIAAQSIYSEGDDSVEFNIQTQLTSAARDTAPELKPCQIRYRCTKDSFTITALCDNDRADSPLTLCLPIVCSVDEAVEKISDKHIEIIKTNGKLVVKSDALISIRKTKKPRTFNMVPGCQAIIIDIKLPQSSAASAECRFSVEA